MVAELRIRAFGPRGTKVDDTFDLASVRAFINCSEPCKPATFRRFLDYFSFVV